MNSGLPTRIGMPKERYPMPNLLVVQRESFGDFLQENVSPEKRKNRGLQAVFREIFPVEDLKGEYRVEFVSYRVGEPRFTPEECKRKNLTYAVPLWVTLRVVRLENGEVVDQNEQEVYFADFPYMTPWGTFIVNGVERVIVSQIHRSPGVYFEVETRTATSWRALLVPYRGPWVETYIDGSKQMVIVVSKRRKIPVTRFVRVLGYKTHREVLHVLYPPEEKSLEELESSEGSWLLAEELVDEDTGEVAFTLLEEVSPEVLEWARNHGKTRFLVYDAFNPRVEVLVNTFRHDRIKEYDHAVTNIYRTLRYTPPNSVSEGEAYIRDFFFNPRRFFLDTVGRFKLNSRLRHEELGLEVPPEDQESLHINDFIAIFRRVFELYMGNEREDDVDDLSNRRVRRVGELLSEQFLLALQRVVPYIRERIMMEKESARVVPRKLINPRQITAIILSFFTTERLSQFLDQTNPLAELTHKRRISALGRGGLTRQTAGFEVRDVHPSHYGRVCPIETPEGQNIGLILSLTTYADIDSLGFITTPLIKVSRGRLKKDKNGNYEIHRLTPYEEAQYKIAAADTPVDPETGKILAEEVWVRHAGGYMLAKPQEVDFIDVSPRQILSPATSLIPFLEHDDANRALMGSNMQRQAIPLIAPEPPLVGTGMEGKVARDSGAVIRARRAGVVRAVDARRIVVEAEESDPTALEGTVDVYELVNFKRSNQDTLIHHRPIVRPGQRVEAGQVLADASGTYMGELAHGRNLRVAFLPWYGYNFEDAIVLSERVVREDLLTSIHILELEVQVRETKLGPEEVTRDLPYVSEEMVRNLDEYGIIRIGAEVKPDDILVGKVTPKGERELTPEERLILSIFQEKAKDVRDTSLRVPPDVHGVVADVVVLSRRKDDPLTHKLMQEKKLQVEEEFRESLSMVLRTFREHARRILVGKRLAQDWVDVYGRTLLKKGEVITEKFLEERPFFKPMSSTVEVPFSADLLEDREIGELFERVMERTRKELERLTGRYEEEIGRIERGDNLPPGVLQIIKVYIAQKRKIQVGDKLAGRHGNKGVVSIIAPVEDMPFMDDGTPVDVVVNPLGVPSRMNVGQILETVLGRVAVEGRKKLREMLDRGAPVEGIRALLRVLYEDPRHPEYLEALNSMSDEEVLNHARKLAEEGVYYAAPAFESLSIEDIQRKLEGLGLDPSGKVRLRDGRSGDYFDAPVTVGHMYIMKLVHMVEDKIHARSTGPYSLITQQPVGGKSRFGGQRFGEMEVWALEAHGAAYTLQEMLTVKSDDIEGRKELYRSLIKGQEPPEPKIPESFNVLVKHLQGLGLSVEILTQDEENKTQEKGGSPE